MPSTPFSKSRLSLGSETSPRASESVYRNLSAPLNTSTVSNDTRRLSGSKPLRPLSSSLGSEARSSLENPTPNRTSEQITHEMQNLLKTMGATSLADGFGRRRRSASAPVDGTRNSNSSFRHSQMPGYIEPLDGIMGKLEISTDQRSEPVKAFQIPPGESRATRITGGLNRDSRFQEKEDLHKFLVSGDMNPRTGIHVYRQVQVTEEANPNAHFRKSSSEIGPPVQPRYHLISLSSLTLKKLKNLLPR